MRKHGPEFVEKLYSILEDSANAPYITWSPSSTSFIIINPLEFGQSVLSNHFKHNNLSSFVRQLNKYDFHKIKSTNTTLDRFGPKIWEFENVNFQKNKKELLTRIKRKKGNGKKNSSTLLNLEPENKDNSVINTLKVITRYFQVIMEDIIELKKDMIKEDIPFDQNLKQYNKPNKYKPMPYNILLCENDINSNSYSKSILSSMDNINIIDCISFSDFLMKIKSLEINILILSIDFPNIWNIVHEIRENNHILPIVLLVNNTNNTEYIRYLSRGISEVIVKPYHHETMVAVIKKYYIANKK